jgi:hypothetical protein
MNQASIFVNDAAEAGRIVREVPSKGRIYSTFRFDPAVPDILACDFETHTIRKDALGPAIESLRLKGTSKLISKLISSFSRFAESGEKIDTKKLFTLFSFDVVCEVAFNYDLDAINGSADGAKLWQSLATLADAQAGTGA